MAYREEFLQQLKRMNIFVALFYAPAWLDWSIGSDAIVNDILFLKDKSNYKEFDAQVVGTVFDKLAKHRWYLQQKTITYYMFNDHSTIT